MVRGERTLVADRACAAVATSGLRSRSGTEEADPGGVLHGRRSMDEWGWSCNGGPRHKGGRQQTDGRTRGMQGG